MNITFVIRVTHTQSFVELCGINISSRSFSSSTTAAIMCKVLKGISAKEHDVLLLSNSGNNAETNK
jgi:hypothetical protein